jgi:hypothetical protein
LAKWYILLRPNSGKAAIIPVSLNEVFNTDKQIIDGF